MSRGLYVKYPLFSSGFNGTGIFWAAIAKHSNVKFYENSSSRNRVVPWEQGDEET
jgi:hypothetical protein